MANDEKMSLANLTTKQKGIAAAFVVVVLVIIWQVMGIFGGGGGGKAPAPAAVPKMKPMASAAPTAGTQPSNVPGGAPLQGAPTPAPVPAPSGEAPQMLSQTNVMSIQNDKKLLETQQQQQKDVVDALNKLQLLKLQREIAETNQAISTASLATATADKAKTDLLTKPAPQNVPAGAYANSLVGPVRPGMQTGAMPQPAAIPEAQYVVISVSMQLNRWNAVLGMQGKLYNVHIGDQLQDGSTVTSINKDGVILKKNNEERKISLVSSI